MATSKSIRAHLDELHATLLEAQEFSRTCGNLVFGQSEPPGWVFCWERQMERIRAEAESLEVVLRQQALPLIEDFERAKTKLVPA